MRAPYYRHTCQPAIPQFIQSFSPTYVIEDERHRDEQHSYATQQGVPRPNPKSTEKGSCLVPLIVRLVLHETG